MLVIILLQIFSWFWQRKRFENWSVFDEKVCHIIGPPCTSVLMRRLVAILYSCSWIAGRYQAHFL